MPIIEAKSLNTPNEYCILTTMPALSKKGLMKLKGRTFSEEEYELLREALKASGFHNVNGAVNTIANYVGYKAFCSTRNTKTITGIRSSWRSLRKSPRRESPIISKR